jgi:hypothetical protein
VSCCVSGSVGGREQVRGVEQIASLCLPTDLGMGFPFEQGCTLNRRGTVQQPDLISLPDAQQAGS